MKATNATVASVKTTVEMFARRYAGAAGGHVGYDDLLQVGYMAAMKAAETFDSKNGAALATYCRMPVKTAMKNAVAAWRGTMLSLDAPVSDDEAGSTYLDAVNAECATPEEAYETHEHEALVRSLVEKALGEFEAHQEMARLLVGRLMEGTQGEERFRAEGGLSVRDIGEKFGVSRQTVLNVEKKLRARLAEVLKEAA